MFVITGDTHKDYDIQKLIDYNNRKILNNDDYVIVCGDFGVSKYMRSLLELYDSFNFTTLFVDGNHENYDILNDLPTKKMFGETVDILSKKVYHLKRGHIYNICDTKVLTIGGALSQDKEYRINSEKNLGYPKCWWKEENITTEDEEKLTKSLIDHNYKVDIVLSHTCPSSVHQQFLHLGKFLSHKIKSIPDPNETVLEKYRKMIKFKHWYFGHYHTDYNINNRFTMVYNNFYQYAER